MPRASSPSRRRAPPAWSDRAKLAVRIAGGGLRLRVGGLALQHFSRTARESSPPPPQHTIRSASCEAGTTKKPRHRCSSSAPRSLSSISRCEAMTTKNRDGCSRRARATRVRVNSRALATSGSRARQRRVDHSAAALVGRLRRPSGSVQRSTRSEARMAVRAAFRTVGTSATADRSAPAATRPRRGCSAARGRTR